MSEDRNQILRNEIETRVRELIQLRQAQSPFTPGSSTVPYAARVYDESEVWAGVSSMLDFWLTLGPEGQALEKEFAQTLGVRHSILTNSGSSANLLAMAALTSHKLGDRRIKPRDEVITAGAGFPTTVTAIIQVGAVPVFVDVDPLTTNLLVEQLEDAYCEGKTKAVFLAHTLANPFDLETVSRFCQDKGLWLVEDNCDALGSRYGGKNTGTFGDLSTQSFYPPHHMTMGEGGMINASTGQLKVLVESFRDWGRDCWCASGKDDTCKKRFSFKLGDLPDGYDHKYIYSHLGYNLKPIDPQAAIGREQLKKLSTFTQARIDHWNFLRRGLDEFSEELDFMLPTHARRWTPQGFEWMEGKPVVEPSWFGFMMLVKPNAGFSRRDFATALDQAKIGNRALFGGNLVRQPFLMTLQDQFAKGESLNGVQPFRTVGALSGADRIMNEAIFMGVYPGLSEEQLGYMVESIRKFIRR